MAMRSIELRGVEPFASLPRPDLAAIAGAARSTMFARGTLLFGPDGPCENVGWVYNGFVRLYHITILWPVARRSTTGLVQPGGLLTIAPLLNQPVHDCHAEALGQLSSPYNWSRQSVPAPRCSRTA